MPIPRLGICCTGLCRSLVWSLVIEKNVECYETLINFLLINMRAAVALLAIDQAQNMDLDTLEEHADKYQLILLILVGQPEPRDTLKRPQLVHFA